MVMVFRQFCFAFAKTSWVSGRQWQKFWSGGRFLEYRTCPLQESTKVQALAASQSFSIHPWAADRGLSHTEGKRENHSPSIAARERGHGSALVPLPGTAAKSMSIFRAKSPSAAAISSRMSSRIFLSQNSGASLGSQCTLSMSCSHVCISQRIEHLWGSSQVVQLVKNPSAMQETPVQFPGREVPLLPTPVFSGFPGGSDGKESTCNAGDMDLIPGLGRSPEEGNGFPLLPTPVFVPCPDCPDSGQSPWTEELGRLRSMGSQTVRCEWATKHSTAQNIYASRPHAFIFTFAPSKFFPKA